MPLATCTVCHGFVVDAAAACLHCGTAPPTRWRSFVGRLLAAGCSITLMACYGAMPNEPYDWPDAAAPDAPADAIEVSDAAPPDGLVPDAEPCDGGACACPTLDEAACETSDLCSPTYTGVNCTNPDGGPCMIGVPCTCESFVFDGCVAD
jgi:hypothetical protein